MTPQQIFGHNLRKRRIGTKPFYTQAEVAQKIGIRSQYVSLIERGERSPSLFVAKQMADLLGIPLDELF